jgi:hypothetical protein
MISSFNNLYYRCNGNGEYRSFLKVIVLPEAKDLDIPQNDWNSLTI